jgi:hypothetical protein
MEFIRHQGTRAMLAPDQAKIDRALTKNEGGLFVELADQWCAYVLNELPDLRARLQSNDRNVYLAAMREAALSPLTTFKPMEWCRIDDATYVLEDGHRQLPNSAFLRYLRAYFWYSLLRVRRAHQTSAKFENNRFDLEYVFLSLYTRHLWTADNEMMDAVDMLGGGRVRVYPRDGSLP